MSTDEAVKEFFAGRPTLDRLLFVALKHRLFLAFLLVGKLSLPPQKFWACDGPWSIWSRVGSVPANRAFLDRAGVAAVPNLPRYNSPMG